MTLVRKTGYPLICSYDNQGIYPEQSLYFFYERNDVSNEYLLLLFNSSLYNWFYKNFLVTNIDSTPQLKNKDLDEFPIIQLNRNIEKEIKCLASYLLFLAKNNSTSISFLFFKEIADCLVFEIFLEKEVLVAKKGIIEHLQDLKSIDDTSADEQKLAIINSELERLYDPYHPVRNNVETIENIEIVRIIKESLKK